LGSTSVEFYATPEEQRIWLSELTADPLLWFVVDAFPESPAAPATATVLRQLTLEGRGHLQIFLGRKDLGPGPQWRIAGQRKELHFTASQAIQLVPSLAHENVLIEGRLAIMRRSEYQRDGIAFEPLASWFRVVSRSLKAALNARETRLITYSSTEPPAPSRRKVLVSRGAIDWRKSGKRLQQTPGSLIEFDIPRAAVAD
jgi:hypothetical protein